MPGVSIVKNDLKKFDRVSALSYLYPLIPVTFDQNVKNAISAEFEILAASLPVCQSVIFGSLTLRKARALNFGVKFNFSKTRMEPVMHDFLAITETEKEKSEQSSNNRGKVAR